MGTGSSKSKQLKEEIDGKINQLQNILKESKKIMELCESLVQDVDDQIVQSDQKFRLLKDQKEQLKTKWIELVENDDEQTLVQNQQDYQELQRYFNEYPQFDLTSINQNNTNIRKINQFVLKMQSILNPLILYKDQNYQNIKTIMQLENELVSIKEQITLNLEQILEKNNRLLYLNSQNSNFEQKYQQMDTLINNFQNLKNKFLNKKIQSLIEQNKKLQEVNRELKASNEELTSNNTLLQQESEKIFKSNYKNKEELLKYGQLLKNNEESLRRARESIDRKELEVQQITEQQQNQLQNEKILQQDLENLKMIVKLENEKAEQQFVQEQLKNEIRKKQQEFDKLKQQTIQQDEQIEEIKKEKQILLSDCQKQILRIQEKDNQINEQKEKLFNSRYKMRNYQRSIERQKSEIKSNKGKISTMQKYMQEQKHFNDAEHQKQLQNLNEIQNKVVQLESQIKVKNQEYEDLKQNNQHLELNILSLQQEIGSKNTIIEDFSNKNLIRNQLQASPQNVTEHPQLEQNFIYIIFDKNRKRKIENNDLLESHYDKQQINNQEDLQFFKHSVCKQRAKFHFDGYISCEGGCNKYLINQANIIWDQCLIFNQQEPGIPTFDQVQLIKVNDLNEMIKIGLDQCQYSEDVKQQLRNQLMIQPIYRELGIKVE